MDPYDHILRSLARDVKEQNTRLDEINEYNSLITIDSLLTIC